MGEAQRVLPGLPREWEQVVGQARDYAEMALRKTREFTPEVVARFGVEVIYDLTYRTLIGATLSVSRPSLWHWESGQNARGRQALILLDSGMPDPGQVRSDGYMAPIPGPAIPRLRRFPSLLDKVFRTGVVSEHEWTNKPLRLLFTYLWAMDSIRPPVASMRVAAEIINETFSMPTVVGVELGHSVGAQTLAAWLHHDVHTDGDIFTGDGPCIVDEYEAHAVVLNIPCQRLICYVTDLMDGTHFDRRLVDLYWNHRNWGTPADLVRDYLDYAASYLRPGGLLIVLGDVEDSVHHQAVDLIGHNDGFRSHVLRRGKVRLDTVERPILFSYPRRPWCPFGVVPPTDRLMSVWRRVP